MSEELNDEVRAFLNAHVVEPDAESLERVRARVIAPGRRSRFPPELLAVAAVLVAIAAVQVVVSVIHPRPGVEAEAVIAAYRSGDTALAQRLAADCSGAGCKNVLVELARIEKLRAQPRLISPQESAELHVLETKWMATEWSASELAQRARTLKVEGHLDEAAALVEQCVRRQPESLECLRNLASMSAELAARDSSAPMMDRARVSYRRYLELAGADDPYRNRIETILKNEKEESGESDESGVLLTLRVGTHGEVHLEPFSSVVVIDPKTATATIVNGDMIDVFGLAPGKTRLEAMTPTGLKRTVTVVVLP